MKKLWVVTIESETVVAAEDRASAVNEARYAIRLMRQNEFDARAEVVRDINDLPDGWTVDCIPFGGAVAIADWMTAAGTMKSWTAEEAKP